MNYLSTNHCLLQLESCNHSFWLCVGGIIDDNLPITPTSFDRNSLVRNTMHNWSVIDPLLIEKVPKRLGSKPTTGHTVCSSARNSLSGFLEKDASTNNPTVVRNMTGIWMPKRLGFKTTAEYVVFSWARKLIISDLWRGCVHKQPDGCSEHDWHIWHIVSDLQRGMNHH